MQHARAPRDRPRRPRRQRRPIPIALSIFVIGLLASSICFVLAYRTPFPTARSYAHYAASSLSIIPKLADPGPSLDHHNPASFVSKILVERVAGSPEIKKVQQTILDVFRSPPLAADPSKGRSGWHIEEHDTEASTPYGKKQFKNLIFTKDPHASRRLVIAAHYDSKYFAKGSFIGATDSAAPCAMLVDLAYSLDSALEGIKGSKEDVTLQLLFFDGEEAFKVWTHTDSTYGSRALASNWSTTYHRPRRLTSDQAPIRKIDSMETLVLLDLLGAPEPSIPSYFTTTNWLFEELVASERRLAEAGLLYPSQDQAINKKSFFRSGFNILGGIEDDHLPFLANGVPILHLIPSPFPRVWHSLKDDATALDYPTNYAWAMIMRLFVSELLQLDLSGVKPSEITARWAEMQQEQRREEESWGEEEDQPGRMGSWAAKGHVTSRSEEELASTR